MSPEATIELLNTYYALMFEAVTSNGGIVSLMVGDGLMALFGAPQPVENSAQQAVSAAREMLSMLDVFNAERHGTDEPELKVGFGVATGEVIAGYAGTDTRATYTCIGKTVNLAARLEAHTKAVDEPILLDAQTHQNLEDASLCQSVPAVQFKGFSEVLNVFSTR